MMYRRLLYFLFVFSFLSCDTEPKEKTRSFDAYGPAEYLWERWTYPNESFDEVYFNKVLKGVESELMEKDGQNDLSWRIEGPLNIGGRINVVVLNPDNEEEIWIGTSSGGVFRSLNSGDEWEAIGESFTNMSIGTIAFDPNNSDVIYVGTGDPNISGYPKTGDGIYKTEDGGSNWEHIGPSEVGVVSKIIVDQYDSETLYMASLGTPYFETPDRGVYKSEDGGESWTQVLYLASYAGISSMVAHPSNPDTLYAAGWDRIRSNTQSIVSGNHSRIYRTYDGGQTWDTLAGGLPQVVMSRAAIDISLSNPDVLYASFVDASSFEFYGVYRSEDNGDTWEDTETFTLDGALGGFGWYFGMVRINPTNEDIVHLGGVELHSTTNSGANWYQSTPNWWEYIVHADMHDLTYASSGEIYLATDGGLYVSSDDMDTWQYISYLPISQFYRVTSNPHESEMYTGGAQDNGTTGGNYENAEAWPRIYGGDGFQALYNPDEEEIMYASTQNGNFNISYDGGQFFEDFNAGIDENDRVAWDAPLVMSSHDPDILYTGTTKVYKNEGFFWEAISDPLNGSTEYLSANRHVITTVAESPINAEVLYAGTSDGKVWVTQDGGGEWIDISEGLPDRYVTDITASPTSEGSVVVTHSGYKDGDDIPHIHRSDDYGANWEGIDGDLPDFGLNNVEILANNEDSILFVASDGGVYYTENSGITWDRLGDNMPIILVFDIDIDYDANRIVAGTFARSIQSLSLDSLFDFSTSIAELEQENWSVYPNPVKDKVYIESENSWLGSQWTIVDLNGRKVAAGSLNSNSISTADLSKGIYFLRIDSPEGMRLKKVIKE
jgi:photosystem II stability/assembly factor-like uncharacterized protein